MAFSSDSFLLGFWTFVYKLKQRHTTSLQMIRPRFPLFGGWQTNYVLGYNVPSYEYLFTKGSNYMLRMRVLDHIYDNMIVDEVTLKVHKARTSMTEERIRCR